MTLIDSPQVSLQFSMNPDAAQRLHCCRPSPRPAGAGFCHHSSARGIPTSRPSLQGGSELNLRVERTMV